MCKFLNIYSQCSGAGRVPVFLCCIIVMNGTGRVLQFIYMSTVAEAGPVLLPRSTVSSGLGDF